MYYIYIHIYMCVDKYIYSWSEEIYGEIIRKGFFNPNASTAAAHLKVRPRSAICCYCVYKVFYLHFVWAANEETKQNEC